MPPRNERPPVTASAPESLVPQGAAMPPLPPPPEPVAEEDHEGEPEPVEQEAEVIAEEDDAAPAVEISRSRSTKQLAAYIDTHLWELLDAFQWRMRTRHRRKRLLIGNVYDAVIAVGLSHQDEVEKLLKGLR